ncbi:MAG: FeoB-associated Cys-rich membrane protein [Muribaculaceae bacterium]|nr:FeoB-associated Cys-rich membrane protein [Muribaculaceae bacterium]
MDSSTNLLIQYIIVGLILTAIFVWVVFKIMNIKKEDSPKCCGCSLEGACAKKRTDHKFKIAK